MYVLGLLRHEVDAVFENIQVMMVPTSPSIYTQDEVAANPVERNTDLGYYTNFVNLMDMCALALPNGFRADGLPTGITLIAPKFNEQLLLDIGERWQQHVPKSGVPKL
eukprot:NODE_14296_length_451_cov_0.780488_g13997_i0.p1 GENE.NODE_14296_length_451_cov_0.780488_g13997_i0~~NODE_14296_length_451_cov_0.780488_g13997_i0.p1  ORF type:complete len:108 (-),score=28.19 NODE_14296_length_451_cov_0.780488_g13997_i0:128-451(-)